MSNKFQYIHLSYESKMHHISSPNPHMRAMLFQPEYHASFLKVDPFEVGQGGRAAYCSITTVGSLIWKKLVAEEADKFYFDLR